MKIVAKSLVYITTLSLFVFPAFVYAATVVDIETVTITAYIPGVELQPHGGVVEIPDTAVRFSGEAYPSAQVFVMKNGVEVDSVFADAGGYFTITLPEKYDQNTLYTLYAVDINGERSLLINYPLVVYEGYLTHVSGVRFAPTITPDKFEVKEGDYLTIFGSSLPSSKMKVSVGGLDERSFSLESRSNGTYEIALPLSELSKGEYVVYVNYINDKRKSKLIKFKIGDRNILNENTLTNLPGDCNVDRKIDLVDFSVLAYWYKRPNPPVCVDTNRDGIINLIDFSILAFYWTG